MFADEIAEEVEEVDQHVKSVKFEEAVESTSKEEPSLDQGQQRKKMSAVSSKTLLKPLKNSPNSVPNLAKPNSGTEVSTIPEKTCPTLRRPKSAAVLSNGNHKSTRGTKVDGQGGFSAKGPSRPVTAEAIKHMNYDENHPIGGSNGDLLSPKRTRQPLAWQYAKLPTYDGAKSPYGLSSRQLEERER